MLGDKELDNRYSYHAPTPKRIEQHQIVRTVLREAAGRFDAFLPEGREKALVNTHLENAMFWANAALARNPDNESAK